MKGADEYYDLFNGKSQQIGRLYFQCHTHARGKCFEIVLLSEGQEVKGNPSYFRGNGSVEVYGMTGGQRGWTETYGWLYNGKWKDDFKNIIKQKKADKDEQIIKAKALFKSRKDEEQKVVESLLSDYV